MYQLLLSLFFISNITNAETFKINEKLLVNYESPLLRQYAAEELQSKINLTEFEDKFDAQINASLLHKIDQQKALNNFAKPTSPFNTREISLSKAFISGGKLKLKAYQDLYSNGFIKDSSQTGVGLELALDLIDTFWQKNTKNLYQVQKLSVEFQKSIKTYKNYLFKNGLRRIYWQLVANDLSLKVLSKLHLNTKKQVQLVAKKFKASISDEGDYARIQAQEISTKSLILSYNYQKEQLIKQLKILLPDSLMHKEIILDDYKIDEVVAEIKTCSAQVAMTKINLGNSLLSQQNELNKGLTQLKQKLNHNYKGISLNVMGSYDYIGKGFGTSESTSDFAKNSKNAYSIGLALTIPLGSSKTKKLKVEHAQQKLTSQLQQSIAKMKSYHEQTVSMIMLLNQSLINQVQQNKLLKISLKSSNKKYKQARLTIEQLIIEENNLLQSDLNIIQAKLTTVETLLDYFSIFHKTPCKFNIITL